MGEETTKIRTNHTLPSASISVVKILFYVGSDGFAVENIIEIQSFRSSVHGLDLHLARHICVLYQSFAFQHPFPFAEKRELVGICSQRSISFQSYLQNQEKDYPKLIYFFFQEYYRTQKHEEGGKWMMILYKERLWKPLFQM